MLVIIGGFVYWFGCSLRFFNFKKFFKFYYFFLVLFFLFKKIFFLPFFLTFLQRCVTYRVLVLQLGVRPEPPRWESLVQDTGPPETTWPHVISIGESSPRELHLNTKTQLHTTASKLQCGSPDAKQLARQGHSSTH